MGLIFVELTGKSVRCSWVWKGDDGDEDWGLSRLGLRVGNAKSTVRYFLKVCLGN